MTGIDSHSAGIARKKEKINHRDTKTQRRSNQLFSPYY